MVEHHRNIQSIVHRSTMTISYNDSFLNLLLYWKGSLYKVIWKEVVIFILLYYCVHWIYAQALDSQQQIYFRHLRDSFESATHLIPLKFILGFFVTNVMGRWWCQLELLNKPDALMLHVMALFQGRPYRQIRRAIARWLTLATALKWREMSSRILKRFPTPLHMARAGLMTQQEYLLYSQVDSEHGNWFVPIVWVTGLLRKCHKSGIINSSQLVYAMSDIAAFQEGPAKLTFYQWICIPLLYTQVATIAAYGYFAICLIGRQVVDGDPVTFPLPIFTCLQFVFFIGWLKVGQALINPFGEDEDDFELNYLLERNLHISMNMADESGDLKTDMYGMTPNTMLSVTKAAPYTKASQKVKDQIPKGHVRKVSLLIGDLQVVHASDAQRYDVM